MQVLQSDQHLRRHFDIFFYLQGFLKLDATIFSHIILFGFEEVDFPIFQVRKK